MSDTSRSDTDYAWIRVEVRPPQGRITLNRPAKRNPLSMAAVAEIADALRDLEREPAVRAMVITGAGEVFSAGADLRGFLDRTPLQDRAEYTNFVELHRLVPRLTKPVIAMVNGLCLAGGCALTALCDLAIASERAQFAYTEVERGIGLGVAMVTLQRSVPRKKALELALRARRIDAHEAERLGLVNQVAPHEQLEAAVEELVADFARKSPMAIAFAKEAFYALQDLPYEAAVERGRDLRVISRTSTDSREGIAAFLEKRAPVWTGR
ncbi:MAG: enoyl-CoA hydratase/isomerase family protein [Chloroflexi bacterium]|nr:enoyl-CoA hydratase/isomerase family protein [Chloroflexota bacterium]